MVKNHQEVNGLIIWMLLISCIFFNQSLIFAQKDTDSQTVQPLKFRHFKSNDGLPQNSVLAIHQDEKGFIWMGTDDGLARYDGYEFRVFRHEPGDSTSINHNVIRSIISDPLNNLWIGTEGGGVSIFDPNFEHFYPLHSLQEFPSALRDAKISSMILGRDHTIWIGTNGSGIFSLKINYEFKSATKDNLIRFDVQHFHSKNSRLSDDKIWSLFEDSSGRIWTGTHEKGASYFQNGIWNSVDLLLPDGHSQSVKVFYEDDSGNFWIGTEAFGLFFKGKNESEFKSINLPGSESTFKQRDLNVTSIQEDDQGAIWIGTLGRGLFVYNPSNFQVLHYEDEPNNPYSLNGNSVYTIFRDVAGSIWLGMYSGEGLNKVSPNQQQFEHYRFDPNLKKGLSGKMVKSILKDKSGNLWIGLFNGGLNYLENGSDSFQYLTSGKGGVLSHNHVQCLFQRSNGEIWIGTDGGGITVYNPKKKKYHYYRQDLENDGLSKNEVWAITEDKQGGIWIGTANGGGLNRFDPNKGIFENFFHKEGDQNTIPFNDVRSLLVDSKENLWIGTYGGGLSKMNIKSGQFTHFYPDLEKSNKISHTIITCILEDKKGYIWVGTFGGGLNRINPLDHSIEIFREKDGLPSDVVKAILEDDSGQLWISTVNGLSSMDPVSFTFKNYQEGDGLQSDEFNLGAAFKEESGKLYFGGINGFNAFFPDRIRPFNTPKPPVLTQLRVLNEVAVPNREIQGKSVIDKSISFVKEIELNALHNSFELEFSSLEFLSQERIRFYYKLEGYDSDWIETDSKRRFANYSNLEPGNYIFLLKSSYEGDSIFSPINKIKVNVLPPWYKSTWAFGVYVFLFLIIAYYIKSFVSWRIKLRNDLKFERIEKQKQDEINQLKLRFFTNISHELRTPLMLINSPLDQLVKRNDLPDSVQNQLASIYTNAGRLLRLINQLLDFRKQETGHLQLSVKPVVLSQFLLGIKQSFDVLAEQKNIIFKVSIKKGVPEKLWLDPDQMEKVFFNLIYNAFKFTPEGGIIEIIAEVDSMFLKKLNKPTTGVSIRVKDSGEGIPKNHLDLIFDRFFQVNNKRFSGQVGTGIGLALSKNLVEFHHGHLLVSSIPQVETIFSVWLPNGFDHFEKHELTSVNEDELEKKWINEQTEFFRRESNQTKIKGVLEGQKKQKNTILVVEDNPDLLGLIHSFLEQQFNVLTAKDGNEGLQILKKESVSLIVSDVMMPEMDGIEFCARVKSNLVTSHIPLILLTAKTSHSHQLEGYESGADDYISKPFQLDILVLKIQNLLKTRDKLRRQLAHNMFLESSDAILSSPDEKFFDDSIKIVEQYLDDESFNVQVLVKELGLSRTLVFEKFKALIGKTPSEFIQMIRMKRAAQLIQNSDLKINEIAFKVGFADPKYFSKSFRKYHQVTPSKFRGGLNKL